MNSEENKELQIKLKFEKYVDALAKFASKRYISSKEEKKSDDVK